MEVVAVILVMIGIIQVRVLGSFYPYWRDMQGREFTEWQKYGMDGTRYWYFAANVSPCKANCMN
ncbi:hypothetical protein ABFG93_06975 [Pseudalkalibacillus hwajinpoensis]|uniref:hypothetical protein n=1 Tax=Guptibacillus hwajinpoensis TaxID=208199 RepID=UPI00325A97E7